MPDVVGIDAVRAQVQREVTGLEGPARPTRAGELAQLRAQRERARITQQQLIAGQC